MNEHCLISYFNLFNFSKDVINIKFWTQFSDNIVLTIHNFIWVCPNVDMLSFKATCKTWPVICQILVFWLKSHVSSFSGLYASQISIGNHIISSEIWNK